MQLLMPSIGLVKLTFHLLLLNRFTSYSCDGLQSCRIWASVLELGRDTRQTDRRTDTTINVMLPPLRGQGNKQQSVHWFKRENGPEVVKAILDK